MGGAELILLDTHIWVWFNLAPERLPPTLVQAFEGDEAFFGISAISVWETVTAMQKGRIATVASPENTLRNWLLGNPFQVIPLDEEIALLSRTLSFVHDDPADRFIAATAYRLNCPLATTDDRLLALPWLKVLN